MSKYVELTTEDGLTAYVNTNHIQSIKLRYLSGCDLYKVVVTTANCTHQVTGVRGSNEHLALLKELSS